MEHNINNLDNENFLSAYEIIDKILSHYKIKSSEFCSIIGSVVVIETHFFCSLSIFESVLPVM